MAATLQDLIAYQTTARALRDGLAPQHTAPTPHSFQQAPPPPPAEDDGRRAPICESPDLVAAFAKLDEMSARLDAILARNGRWTRYVTGVEP